MIGSVIQIIDRIIEFLKIRRSNRRILFEDHIEPVYTELSLIHKDYLKSCRELMEFVSNGGGPQKLDNVLGSESVHNERS